MNKRLNLTDEQREQASRDIRNFFAFTEEVLENPSILDKIPDGAEVDAVPKEERDETRRYDIETPTMVATVTPAPPEKQSNRPRRSTRPKIRPSANVFGRSSQSAGRFQRKTSLGSWKGKKSDWVGRDKKVPPKGS